MDPEEMAVHPSERAAEEGLAEGVTQKLEQGRPSRQSSLQGDRQTGAKENYLEPPCVREWINAGQQDS